MRGLKIFFLFVCTSMSCAIFGLTTSGNMIIKEDGTPLELKGVNWFGFNNQQTMVDGLWSGSDSLTLDFATVAYRMQLLGFNAVRLPFSFKDLHNLTPRNFVRTCPEATTAAIQQNVTNPSVPVPPGSTIPPQVYTPPSAPGICNDYLPNDTTFNRFLWVVNFFARNGFYVLLDNHLREDQTAIENPALWVNYWAQLIEAVSEDPLVRDKIMVDILNEPDNYGIRWEASSGKPALKDLYLSAMDAMYAVNPEVLFFIEGTGQGGIGANWGDGFVTDPQLISQYGLSNPNPFFETLLTKPYLNQVVISPHVYPPTVTGANTNYAGTGLWNRLSNSFGYLTQTGYCKNGVCKIFPVALGEFGSRLTDSRDIISMNDLALYLNNSGSAADGRHQAIGSWFYWSWNANSGDTGGIVENNWKDIVWRKIDYLEGIGLSPWYRSVTPIEMGTLCVSIREVPNLPQESLKPIVAGHFTFTVPDFDTPVCQSIPAGTYTLLAPRITTSQFQFDADAVTVTVEPDDVADAEIIYVATPLPEPEEGDCTVMVALGTPWQEGGVFKNTLNLYIKNLGNTDIQAPWTLAVANPSYTAVNKAWNLQNVSLSNGTITASATQSWQTLRAAGQNTVNVGMILSSSASSFLPTSILINGQECTIQQQ